MAARHRPNNYWRRRVNPNLKLAYSINQTADYLNKQADIVPVSYTHLDVYKRQSVAHINIKLALNISKALDPILSVSNRGAMRLARILNTSAAEIISGIYFVSIPTAESNSGVYSSYHPMNPATIASHAEIMRIRG